MTTYTPAQLLQFLQQIGIPVIGAADATLNLPDNSTLTTLNNDAQLASTAAALGGNQSLGWAAANLATAGTAAATGSVVFLRDYNTYQADLANNASASTILNDKVTMAGDGITVVGDAINLSGAMVSQVLPEARVLGQAISGVGTGLTVMGMAATNFNDVSNFFSLAQSNIQAGNYQAFFSPSQNQVLSNASATVQSAWSSASSQISGVIGSLSNLLNDVNNSSSFTSAANSFLASLGSTQTSLTNFANATNFSTPQVNENFLNNGVSVSDNALITPTYTPTFFSNSDSTVGALQLAGSDGSGAIIGNGQALSYTAGSQPSGVSVDNSGTVNVSFSQASSWLAAAGQTTPYTIQGATSASISAVGNMAFTAPTTNGAAAEVVIPASGGGAQLQTSSGTTINIPASANGASTTIGLGSNGTNGTAAVTTIGSNGSTNLTAYNTSTSQATLQATSTGSTVSATFLDNAGNAILGFVSNQGQIIWNQLTFTQTPNTNINYAQFQAAVANALAAQTISKFLFTNNLPASLAVQALAATSINAAFISQPASAPPLSTTGFSAQYAQSLTSMAAGIGGSIVGTDLAKAIGIPTVIGATAGNVVSTVVTQQITSYIAQTTLDLAPSVVGGSIINGTLQTAEGVSQLEQFVDNFGGVLETAGFGLLGQEVTQALIGNGNEGSQIGGALGEAALSTLLTPLGLGPIGAFLGEIGGSLIGDVIGDLFGEGYRGAPLVQAGIGVSNGQFTTLEVSEDNKGNINDAISIGAALSSYLNQILTSIGGTVTSSAQWSIGYADSNNFSLPLGSWPPSNDEISEGGLFITSYPSSPPPQEVFSTMQAAIQDAAFHLLKSAQITGGNPIMMWELETSSATNMNDLLTDMGIAQVYQTYTANPLALAVSIAASGNISTYQTFQSDMSQAQNLGLSRLSYDGTTLTVGSNAGLIAGDLATLSRMPGTTYTFTFTDTAANLLATLGTWESLAAGGHLASVAFTDATAPTLSFSAMQIASNLNFFQAFTGNYVLNVTDTAANVSAILATLQSLAASNHLGTLTLTDSGTPSFTLSAVQLATDAGALGKITSSYKVVVQDTAANISANFAALQAAQAAGHLTSITATDSSAPVLGLSYAQYTQGTATLALMTTSYSLGLVDSGANVETNLAALQSLVSSGKLVSVTFTDATKPSLSVSVAQTSSYASLLALMNGSATITVTGIAANTNYTITGNGLTLPLVVGSTVQSTGTNSFLDTLNGSNLTVTLTNSTAVVDASGNATFTTPLSGFGSSSLHLGTNGTAVFTVGSDNLTFQANALQGVSYANGVFSFGAAASSSAYTETVTWNPTTGVANLVLTAVGGQPVTTSLGQVNPGSVFLVSGPTISNTNASNQLLLSTTVNTDGSQINTVYNFSGGANKDTATTFNTAGQQTSIRYDHTDGSTYTSYTNPTTQAVIANLTINSDGSGSISTANNQTISFAAGSIASGSVGSAGDTLLTIKTLSGAGITETFDMSSGQIVSTVNGNALTYTLANAGASIDASGNVTVTGGGSTLTIPANGSAATFVVGQDTLTFAQNVLQSLSLVSGAYMFGLASPATGFSESISWNPTTGLANLIVTQANSQPAITPLGLISSGGVLSVAGSTITNTASGGTVISSTTVAADGSFVNSFNNSTGALHVAANGTGTFIYGSDQLIFQPGVLQSYSSSNGVFTFVINAASSAYAESVTWNPSTGVANLVLTATGGSPVTTSLGQINPGSVFSVAGSTITNTNSSGQLLLSTTVNADGSQIDTVYNFSGGSNIDAVTTLNAAGQQTAIHWDHTDGSTYTSYTNPTNQAVIANYTVNANGSGSVSTANNQTVSYAAGNSASVSIGSAGDTLLTIKTLAGAGITETLDLSSGTIVATINGNALTYTLANVGASIDASGNVTITGGGSTILLPANGGNASFAVGQDSLSFPQNILHSLSSVSGVYMFGVTSSVTGFNESISWNPNNGMASLVLTPTAGGQSITTSIGQINPGDVLSMAGSTITIAGSNGAPISVTSVNPDGSQLNIFYNNSNTVNETVTSTNAAGQTTSVRWDNANGTTYTTYYNPSNQAVLANRSVNADGSGYVATDNNQTVNFAGGNNIFDVTTDTSGNTLISITPLAGSGVAETLYLAAGQITSTINGNSLAYTLPNPSINYDASGDLTLVASGSTLVLPANGSAYTFTVGQDALSLDPASLISVTPNGSAYNFNLKSQAGSGTSEYVTWSPQTGIATLNMVASNGATTQTNMGYINPGYVLKVSSTVMTMTNASGVVINSYAVQSNGSVIATASGSTYNLTISNSVLGLSGSDTATITGSGNTISASAGDTITLNGSGNTVIATASGAAITNVGSNTNTYKIVDTAANILANLASLNAAASAIASISLTDRTTPTLALTGAQYAADTAALGKIGSAYNLSITGMSAANAAAAVSQAHIASIAVSDTAANVMANIVALETLATDGKLASIALTDSTTPTLNLTATQYAADTAVLAAITSSYNLSVSGVSAANAASVAGNSHVTAITVSDTGANIVANIAVLETLAGGTQLSSIILTDSTTPTLNLTATQYAADTAALAKIGSAYNLSVSGVTAANASATAGAAHVASVTVSDTAANVLSNIAALESVATSAKLSSIALTDSSTPTLTLTWAQYSADVAALGKITSVYNLAITGSVTAATAAGATSAVVVSDTGANVLSYLSQLQTQAAASRITAIFLTDSSAPTLALTATQYSADTTVLADILSAYKLTVSGVTAANAASVASNTHVTSLTVSDTGANVVANIAALETLATGAQLSSISLTDGSTPTLALTSAQYLADTAALGKISSAYNLAISGVTAANASTVAGNTHVTSLTVSDTGADVAVNIAALETLATGSKLSSITLTDSSTPTLMLTYAQYSADTAALNKISSAYNLSISGVTAANASTVIGNTHVTSITVSDTGANIVANIAALQAVGSKLSGITLTDSSAPTLSLTSAQFTSDSAVISKINSAYTLSIAQSGVNFDFAPNALASITTNGSTVTYTVNSAAVGYTETISWASGGKALLTLTNNATSQSFASSLGWLTSGQTLQISGSNVTAYNSSNQAVNGTQVNADGSQADINYDVSGGTWATSTYYYNAAGAQTEIGTTNTNGTASASYYNPALSDALEVNQSVNANGSGTLSTANNQSVSYAAGDTPTISYGPTGDNIATFTTNSGTNPVDVLDMGTSTITATVGSNKVVDSLAGTSVSLDGSGNVTLTAPASGFGNDTLTEAADGTDVFTLLSDSLKFNGSELQSISFANSAFTYGLASSAAGYSENISWNPTTGKAILNLVNGSQTVAESLGYINPGYVIAVNGSLITNTNSSAQVMNSIQINADGSQVDSNYDTTGGTWKDSIYYYSNTGVNTEVRYDNNNGTFVDDFYNSGGTLTGQTIYNADNILHSNTSNVTAINTTGMTTLDVTGSSSVTAAELSGFTSLTNGSGSTDTIYATTTGSYSIAGKSATGNFNLSAVNTTADVTLTGNNQAGQVLTGGAGADTLVVGTGNDTLNGGNGYTAYSFGAAFGQDTINNAFAGNTTAKGEIDFTAGSVTDENLWFQQSGNNLVIDLLGTTDQITVAGWFGSNAGADVQTINAGGLKLDSQVAQLVSAMASYASANTGFNPQTATAMPTNTTLQNAIAASWHH
jgi:hypothetical protein